MYSIAKRKKYQAPIFPFASRIREKERLSEEMSVTPGTTLEQFLSSKLGGSTLSVKSVSKGELHVESGDLIRLRIQTDNTKKKVTYDLYSPKWSRKINIQQLDGFEFMETHAEAELAKESSEAIVEDILLTLDLLRSWARANKYETIESDPVQSLFDDQKRTDAPASKSRSGSRK